MSLVSWKRVGMGPGPMECDGINFLIPAQGKTSPFDCAYDSFCQLWRDRVDLSVWEIRLRFLSSVLHIFLSAHAGPQATHQFMALVPGAVVMGPLASWLEHM